MVAMRVDVFRIDVLKKDVVIPSLRQAGSEGRPVILGDAQDDFKLMMPTEFFLAHIWLIPLFPLAGAALMLLFGKRLPNAGVNAGCVGSVFLSMLFALG